MRRLFLLILVLLPLQAQADPVVDRTLDTVVLPAIDRFAGATAALDTAARADCLATSPALREAYQAAFDAWIPASYFHAGPMEEDGRNLAIAFWPDPKGASPRALRQLIEADGQTLASGTAYARASVAARGLPALGTMLYDPAFNSYSPADPGCRLTRAAAADLAQIGAAIRQEWQGFAADMRRAGPDNPHFLSIRESRQYLYTALLGNLQFDEEQRLGRPLGTPERARPERAEARAPDRPLRNIRLSLHAARALAQSLTDGAAAKTLAALDLAIGLAEALDDPRLDGVAVPEGRAKVDAIREAVHKARELARYELGPELGVSAGFNALDGD